VTLVTLLFGIGTMVYGYENLNSIVLPAWAVKLAIAFGVIVALFSLLGLWGAYKAPDHIENQTRNWSLTLFFIAVFLGFIIQLAVAGGVLTQMSVIQNAKAVNSTDAAVIKLTADIRTTIANNPSKWMDVENYFHCCGYANSSLAVDSTATGAWCPGGSSYVNGTAALPCKQKLLDSAENEARTIGILAIFFALVELFCVMSSFCLLCCVKRSGDRGLC